MAKVYLKTYGCSANKSDTEALAGLVAKKHKIVNKLENADIIIINSCSVKGPTEYSLYRDLEKLSNKKVIITGCVPEANKELIKTKLAKVSIVGLNNQDEINETIDKTLDGERIVLLSKKRKPRQTEHKIRNNNVIEIIRTCHGCLNACTYCSTRLAKGSLHSYSESRIISQVKKAIKDGAKEIWLASEDNAVYGFDRGTNMPNLIQKLTALPEKFFIRIGMANPQHVLPHLKKWVQAYKSPKVFKFLHVPIQASSNSVLKHMRRNHTLEDFKKIIIEFRKEIPNITISTDIICGYPTETQKDWQQTINLINWLQPDVLHINKFWARPNTPASKLKQIPGLEIKRRSAELTKLYRPIPKNKNMHWLNWEGEVLVDEIGKPGSYIARNIAYKPIVIKSKNNLLGKLINIKIIDIKDTYLIGKINKN
jgi:MiaB-like tRNA modifying enzyme